MAVVRPSDGGESAYCNVAPAAYSGGLWQLNRIGELMHLNTSTGELVHTGWQRHELRGVNCYRHIGGQPWPVVAGKHAKWFIAPGSEKRPVA